MIKRPVFVLAGTLLTVIAVYGWFVARQPTEAAAIPMQVSDTACRQVGGVCRAAHPVLGEVSLVFPQGAYYLHPFVAELKWAEKPKLAVETIILDLSMPGMDMGRNRFGLEPDANGKLWRGELLLPVCVTGRNDWEIQLQILADGNAYQARFPLEVKRYQQP